MALRCIGCAPGPYRNYWRDPVLFELDFTTQIVVMQEGFDWPFASHAGRFS